MSVDFKAGTSRAHDQAGASRQQYLSKLFEHSHDMLVLFDASGRASFVSPSVRLVLGYEPEQFAELPPLSAVHPDDGARVREELTGLLAHPGALLRSLFRARHRDGSYRTLELSSVNRIDDPEVAAALTMLRDITPQVQSQEELRRKNDQLQLALGAAHAISWVADLDTRRPTYSSDFREFFGLPADTDGDDIAALIHPDERAAVREEAARSVAANDTFNIEFRGPADAHGTRWYAARGQVQHDADRRPTHLLGMTWNITERKRLEHERDLLDHRMQESQKLESLGVLAGGIAHDFNNILMAILGNANLIRRTLGAEPVAQTRIAQIEDASRRAAELCRQMLAYAGRGRFALTATSLNDLIEKTSHLLEASTNKKALLRFHLQPNLPNVVADPAQIRQVLMNLVTNASDAIGDSAGVISITTGVMRADRSYLAQAVLAPDIPAGDYAFLEVSDTGAGIRPELQSRIFEPFFSSKFAGRGLGLAAVLGIVRGHKGAIRVCTKLDEGTSFRCLLPLADETAAASLPAGAVSQSGRSRGTILLVDDEASVRTVTGQMLAHLGFRVLPAANGSDAVALFRAESTQLVAVLMDLTMPLLDGEEALRELQRIEPGVPVLLMSGCDEQDTLARFAGKGLAGFLQKPFALDTLQERLRLLLG